MLSVKFDYFRILVERWKWTIPDRGLGKGDCGGVKFTAGPNFVNQGPDKRTYLHLSENKIWKDYKLPKCIEKVWEFSNKNIKKKNISNYCTGKARKYKSEYINNSYKISYFSIIFVLALLFLCIKNDFELLILVFYFFLFLLEVKVLNSYASGVRYF